MMGEEALKQAKAFCERCPRNECARQRHHHETRVSMDYSITKKDPAESLSGLFLPFLDAVLRQLVSISRYLAGRVTAADGHFAIRVYCRLGL